MKPNKLKHPIRTGPEGGKYQSTKKGERYLLAKRKIHTGPEGGKYQVSKGEKRYLLN